MVADRYVVNIKWVIYSVSVSTKFTNDLLLKNLLDYSLLFDHDERRSGRNATWCFVSFEKATKWRTDSITLFI